MAGVAAHVGQDGGRDAHAGTMSGSVRSAARMSPLLILFEFQGGTEVLDRALPAPRDAPLPSRMTSAESMAFLSTSRRRMKMVWGCCSKSSFHRVFGTGLDEPEAIGLVDAELRVHDHAVVGLGNGPDAPGRPSPPGRLESAQRVTSLSGTLTTCVPLPSFLVDDLLFLAAHVADDDFASSIPLEYIKLVRASPCRRQPLRQGRSWRRWRPDRCGSVPAGNR